jgi:polyphenol oxidase
LKYFPSLFQQFSLDIFAEFIGGEKGFSSPKLSIKTLKSRFSVDKIFLSIQSHSNIILQEKDFLENIPEGDGILSNSSNIILGIRVADCMGALFYNPKQKVIGAVHAGWRGLSKKIFSEFLLKAKEEYGILPKDFFIALSPSLGKCCAEFSNPYDETPEYFHDFIEEREEKFFVNLWKIAQKELFENGVPEKQIEMPPFCTKCNNKKTWSYRKGDKEERNIFFLYLPTSYTKFI